MKKLIRPLLATFATAGLILTTPVFADHNNHKRPFFNKENVGRIVGTGLGALLGSKVGDGRGNDAAIAAGAVGGYVLGGKIGRDWQPKHRSYTSHNRNHSYSHGHGRSHNYGHRHGHKKHYKKHRRSGYLQPIQYMPELEHIDARFRATRTSNVRGGPSKKYVVVDGLKRGERVRVLGRVIDSNWYLVAQGGIIQGFVHTSLLRPAKRRLSHNNHNDHSDYGDRNNGHYLPSPYYE